MLTAERERERKRERVGNPIILLSPYAVCLRCSWNVKHRNLEGGKFHKDKCSAYWYLCTTTAFDIYIYQKPQWYIYIYTVHYIIVASLWYKHIYICIKSIVALKQKETKDNSNPVSMQRTHLIDLITGRVGKHCKNCNAFKTLIL